MNWYTAHVILYVRLKEHPQDHFPVWENIILIEASSADEANTKAEQRGREDEGDCDGSFTWDGHPATWVYAGVRKLISCVDPEERPDDGTEVSFTQMELPSLEAVQRLAEGLDVSVLIEDESPREDQETDAPESEPIAAN